MLGGTSSGLATLSGVGAVRTLVLPSSVDAVSIGGDFGDKGQVIAKNNITNKLEWDYVDDLTIPDGSIGGNKLAPDIDITTTGDITCNELTLTSNTTALAFTGTGEIVGKAVSLTTCKNLDLSDPSNQVPTDLDREDITFYKSLTGENTEGGPTTFFVNSQGSFTDTRLTMNGDMTITDSSGTDMFKVVGQTGFTEVQGSIDVYGRIRPRKSDEGIKFMNTGKLLGYSVANTVCENLDLTSTTNTMPTDASHEDITFYKSLTGTNGDGGATTFEVDSTTGALQIKRDDVGNTLAYRNIEGHITGTENGGTTTYSLTASNGNFACSDIDFIGGLNGRAVVGLESVATSINLLDATNIIGNPETIVIADATNPGITDSQTFASSFVSPVWGDLVSSDRLNLSFRARELDQSFSCSFFYEYLNTGASVVVQLFFRLYDVTAGAGITETERAFVWHTITSPPSAIRRQITINGYLNNYFSLLATKVLKPQLFCFAPSGTGHTFSVQYGGNIGIGNGVALPHAEFRMKDMPPASRTTINMAN